MLIITLQLMVVWAMLLVMNVYSVSKFGITPIINSPISEFLVFDLEYMLRFFFILFTFLILPGFCYLKIILLFHLSVNAQMCLGCLKLSFPATELTFIEKYKKNKREATWGILSGWNNVFEALLFLYFIVKFPEIYEKKK